MNDFSKVQPTIEPLLAAHFFDLEPDLLWIMHCAEGPMPREAAWAVTEFLPRETRPWTLRWQEDFQDLPQATREQAAVLLGARAEDIALTATTSSGLMALAQGLNWRPGDEVVTPLGEFPANAWPWKALECRGVQLRQVPLWDGHCAGRDAWTSKPPGGGCDPEDRLLATLSPSTRMLAVSWVRFQDGLKLDLRRLACGCADRGIPLVVDGIQGAGTQVIDLEGLSKEGLAAFVSGGHKGLLAPQGMGILWTSPEFRHQLMPTGTWLSVEDATDFRRPSTDLERDFLSDGSRFEPGVPNLVGCAAFEASLRVLNRAGIEALERHIASLRRRLIADLAWIPSWREEGRRLAALDDAGRLGSIVALYHGGRGSEDFQLMLKAWQEKKIYASVREGYFRIALHGYHGSSDIDRIVKALQS